MQAEFLKDKIKDARQKRQMTQSALGQAIERATGRRVESREVYRWENGHSLPSAVCLFGLCRVTGYPVEYFFSAPVEQRVKPTTRVRRAA